MQQTVAQSVAHPLIYNYGLAGEPKSTYWFLQLNNASVKQIEHNASTCFSIGQSMVMVFQIIPDKLRNGLQPMVGQLGEMFSRQTTGATERIVRIRHIKVAKGMTQAPLIKNAVMGH